MRFVRTNGGVAHYADEGPRSAGAVVFINSLGTDFRIWDEVAEPLAKDWRVIRYDKRGHGLSSHDLPATGVADFAADLVGLLEQLGARPATIAGISIGGLIAQDLYRQRRDLVASLVLCDTGHKIGTPEFYDARAETVRSKGVEAIADMVLQGWLTENYHKQNPEMTAGWRAMLARTPREGYIAACRSVGLADLTEAAKAIAAPTLILVGDQDVSTPPDLARALARLIPGSKLEIIEGAKHLPCIEKPDVMRALIETHLKTIAHE